MNQSAAVCPKRESSFFLPCFTDPFRIVSLTGGMAAHTERVSRQPDGRSTNPIYET